MKLNYYNQKKEKYINMIAHGKATYNNAGKIVKDAEFQSRKKKREHIESVRSLFTDTKVVSQNQLEEYRNIVKKKNPYDVLLSLGNVPYSLINNEQKTKKNYSFENSFGRKTVSKTPKLQYSSLEEMKQAKKTVVRKTSVKKEMCSGQSRRAWNELYKVLDSSNVVVHVLDARDPLGTKCDRIESYIEKQAKHKQLIYLLNKVDLVPTSVTAAWLRILSKKYPAVAYHSNSLENNYGKENLMGILRQLKTLYSDKQTLSVGFVGYPNIGKSSIINTLRNKEVCSAAPVPGQTRSWQYITLVKNLYLIDCPGVVPIANFCDAVLRGAIQIEMIKDPEIYADKVVELIGNKKLGEIYETEFNKPYELYRHISTRRGKYLKGKEPNIDFACRTVLHDWYRGKIQYYVLPDGYEKNTND